MCSISSYVVACITDDDCNGSGTCVDEACVCAPTSTGANCQYDVCLDDRAMRPGLAVQFYGANNYQKPLRRVALRTPHIGTTSGGPFPEIPSDYFSAHYHGFVRIQVAGDYSFTCTTDRARCTVYIEQKAVSSTDVITVANNNTFLRFKADWSHDRFNTFLNLQWKVPEATAFANIPDEVFSFTANCPKGCGNNGCCVGPAEECRCNVGFTGPRCEESIDTCSGNAPGELTAGGLRARYFSDQNRQNFVFATVSGSRPGTFSGSPGTGVANDYWSMTFGGRVKTRTTGWYIFRPVVSRGSIEWTIGRNYAGRSTLALYLTGDDLVEISGYYTHDRFGSRFDIYWTGPDFAEELIPSTQLYYYASEAFAGCDCPKTPDGQVCNNQGLCSVEGFCDCE